MHIRYQIRIFVWFLKANFEEKLRIQEGKYNELDEMK